MASSATGRAPRAPSTAQAVHRLRGVTSLVGGSDGCCAAATGGVFCWGSGEFGQLGNGTTTPFSAVPARVQGLDA